MKENQKTKERLVCSECGAVLTETEAHEHDGKILYGTVTQKQTAIQFFVNLAMTTAILAARIAAELYQTTMQIMMMTMNTPIVIPAMNE